MSNHANRNDWTWAHGREYGVVYDRNAGNIDTLVKEGAIGASLLER
jgi:hypothetical protein